MEFLLWYWKRYSPIMAPGFKLFERTLEVADQDAPEFHISLAQYFQLEAKVEHFFLVRWLTKIEFFILLKVARLVDVPNCRRLLNEVWQYSKVELRQHLSVIPQVVFCPVVKFSEAVRLLEYLHIP